MASRTVELAAPGRAPAERLPGREPGPPQRAELLRIWDASDDNGRKLLLFVARQMAKEQDLIPADTPLMITDRAF